MGMEGQEAVWTGGHQVCCTGAHSWELLEMVCDPKLLHCMVPRFSLAFGSVLCIVLCVPNRLFFSLSLFILVLSIRRKLFTISQISFSNTEGGTPGGGRGGQFGGFGWEWRTMRRKCGWIIMNSAQCTCKIAVLRRWTPITGYLLWRFRCFLLLLPSYYPSSPPSLQKRDETSAHRCMDRKMLR
jgi:hypothetical protein